MMTPEEAKVYNRCRYLENIEIELEGGFAEDYLEEGTSKGYFTNDDIAIITEYINARNKLCELAKANRRFDYDW